MAKLTKLTVILLFVCISVSAQTEKKKTKKVEVPTWLSTAMNHFEFNGYAQAGYTYTNPGKQDKNYYDLKRVLFWCKAKVTDRWSFLFMHDFKSVVQEFYTDYRITNNNALTVRFGQFKNSLSMENPLSPTKQELIDVYSQSVTYLTGCGSDPLYGVQYGRDLGLEIYGDLFKGFLHYELEVMNGAPINKKDNNTQKDVIARLEVKPTPNFKVVATGQLGTGHALASSVYCPDIKLDENYTRNRYSIGADYKSIPGGGDYFQNRAVAVHGEVLGGKDGDNKSFGAYVTGCVPVCKALDVIASVDYFNYNTDLNFKQTNLVVGVQHWFYKKCRVQLQYTHCMPTDELSTAMAKGDETYKKGAYGQLQAQVQVAF